MNSSSHVDSLIANIATRQHGIVTLEQLRNCGLSSTMVGHRVRTGRLHRIHHRIFSVGHRRLDRYAQIMAAVLLGGPGAAAGFTTAAELWNIAKRRYPIHVLTPKHCAKRPGLKFHQEIVRPDDHYGSVRNIPVSTLSVTLLDLARCMDAHQLANAMHEAAFWYDFGATETQWMRCAAASRRHHKILHTALDMFDRGSAGTRSELERQALHLVLRSGFPQPQTNMIVEAGGATIEADLFWPEFRLCIEIDGGGHRRKRTRRADQHRDGLLKFAGYQVLRVTQHQLETAPERVIERVKRAMERPLTFSPV